MSPVWVQLPLPMIYPTHVEWRLSTHRNWWTQGSMRHYREYVYALLNRVWYVNRGIVV